MFLFLFVRIFLFPDFLDLGSGASFKGFFWLGGVEKRCFSFSGEIKWLLSL